MTFWSSLLELLFGIGDIPIETDYRILVFATGSAFMGFVLVLLDLILYKIIGRSILSLRYSGLPNITFFILWGLGAGVGGYVGASASIFVINRTSCLTIGVAWPLVLPRLVDKYIEREEELAEEEEVEN